MRKVELNPTGSMNLLSQQEVSLLKQSSSSPLYQLFRQCALAVLSSGSNTDDVEAILSQHRSFEVEVLQRERGVKLRLINPPDQAFVDGELIQGIREHLFAVLRDILFVAVKYDDTLLRGSSGPEATNLVFDLVRNAQVIDPEEEPCLLVCWGGHSIVGPEYDYTKLVGYRLGLRGMNICTGCGPGAMKGPMKGATIGHAKQRTYRKNYIGLTEPGIIAAEPPNAIVNQLIILPDIEKRLEAFVRLSHGIIIFPGGAGTAEELLYILGVKLDKRNKDQVLPIVLTGPQSAADYFNVLDDFIGATLGPEAQACYEIVIDDPVKVAKIMRAGVASVRDFRKSVGDAYHYNWSINIDESLQLPFEPTHESMGALRLFHDAEQGELAADLRRAFSGIVAGNIKPEAMAAVAKLGPFLLSGEPELMERMDKLLEQFVDQGRMKLPGTAYSPCYRIQTAPAPGG